MRAKKFHITISLCLAVFFLFAAWMTKMSLMNYFKGCVKVTTVEKVTAEALSFTKICYVENTLNANGTMTFVWPNDDVPVRLDVGDQLKVDVGSRILSAEITDIDVADGEWTFAIRIYPPIDDILEEPPEGFIVTAEYKGPFRSYVVPISCIRDGNGFDEIALVYERPKAWGIEYYIHFEPARVYEMNKEKCALINLPLMGEIVMESEGPLFEGMKVIPQ